MKASNKLLIALIAVVFGVPLLLIGSLKESINEGNYKVRYLHGTRRGTIKPYQTLVIKADAASILRCRLRPSDSSFFAYLHHDSSKEDVSIYNSNDTLYIKHSGIQPRETVSGNTRTTVTRNETLNINLFLSAFDDIVLDGAGADIDSLNGPLNVKVLNSGELYLAKSGKRTSHTIYMGVRKYPYDSIYSGTFDQLNLNIKKGKAFVGPYAWIRNMNLQLQDSSLLEISERARIDKVTGAIAERASLNIPFGHIEKIKALTQSPSND